MIISTKGRYGLRAMFELAKEYGEAPRSIKHIAELQGLSEQYLEQLFSKLKAAGLVKSTRGAGGGYSLTDAPQNITVGCVLTALEGPLTPAECVGDDAQGCENIGMCTTHIIWQRIYDGFNNVLDSITLGDMVNDFKRQTKDTPHAKNIKC